MIRHVVAIISDDLHVHRPRALWITFMENTGGLGDHRKPLWLFEVGWLPGDVDAPEPAPDLPNAAWMDQAPPAEEPPG